MSVRASLLLAGVAAAAVAAAVLASADRSESPAASLVSRPAAGAAASLVSSPEGGGSERPAASLVSSPEGGGRERPAASLVSSPEGGGSERPRGVRVGCGRRSMADFPGAYSDPDNTRIGPLVFVGGARAADDPPRVIREFDGQKFPLLVRAGHVVTVQIARAARDRAGLAYGPMPQGRLRLVDAHRTITFTACRRGRPSGSSANGPVTFWSGFVMVREPGCVPLRAWVDDEAEPRRRVMSLGAGSCDRR